VLQQASPKLYQASPGFKKASNIKETKMIKKIAAAAALSLLASASFAATPFYAGVDVGSTRFDAVDTNSSKVSYGVVAGYSLNESVAVELGFRRLGEWKNVYGSNEDLAINQTHLSVVGSVPLKDQFSLFARVGYNKLNGAGESTSGALYGVGLGYNFAPNIVGRLEVQKPASIATNLGLSVAFKF
jgi:hypothetical protein